MARSYHIKAQQDRHKIVELLEEGKSLAEIMQAIGCSESHVRHTAIAYGLNHKVVKLGSRKTVEILADMVTTNKPLTQIAEEHQVCSSTVAKLKKHAENCGLVVYRSRGRPKKNSNHTT